MTKFKNLFYSNPLFYAFALSLIADATFTIAGQSKSYWQNHSLVNEASPVYIVLVISPFAFILGSILWVCLMYFLMKKLRFPYNIFLTLLILIGNSWGSSSWLRKILSEIIYSQVPTRFEISLVWFLIISYFAIVSGVATYFLKIYIENKNKY